MICVLLLLTLRTKRFALSTSEDGLFIRAVEELDFTINHDIKYCMGQNAAEDED
jgi:hypothetical protein